MSKFLVLFMVSVSWTCFAQDLTENSFIDAYEISNTDGPNGLRFDGLYANQTRATPEPVTSFYYRPDLGWIINSESSQRTVVADDTFHFRSSTPYFWQDLPIQLFFDPNKVSLYTQNETGLLLSNPKSSKLKYKAFGASDRIESLVYFPEFDFFLIEGKKSQRGLLDVRSRDLETNPFIGPDKSADIQELEEQGFIWTGSGVRFRGFLILTTLADFLKSTGWNSSKIHATSSRFDVGRELEIADSSYKFLAYDLKGNSYWSDRFRFFVFDRNGILINVIVVPQPNGFFDFIDKYAVHPSGDLFRIVVKGDNKQPIKIQVYQNTWDKEARALWYENKKAPQFLTPLSTGVIAYPFGIWEKATINDSDVRLRQDPNQNATIISQYQKNTPVTILDKTKEATRIGGTEAPWYLVRDWDGRQGWIFGAFLDIAK